MVPVGGELSVAITTEQERIEAAFHEGTPALQARSSREEHVLRWIYRSENMGQAAGRGGTAGATSTEWWLFFSSVPRSGASRGRNAPFFREPNVQIYFFRALNVQIVSFFGNRIFDLPRTRSVVGLVLMYQSQDVALQRAADSRCKEIGEWVDPRQRVTGLTKGYLSCCL